MRPGLVGGLLALALAVAAAPGALAQAAQTWSVLGGLSVSGLRGKSLDVENKLGLALGGAYVFGLGTDFSLEADGLFVMKGAKAPDPLGGHRDFVILDYVEVPILARYDLPTGGTATPHFVFGPTLAFLVSGRYRAANGAAVSLSGVQSIESGLAFGAGLDVEVGERTLIVEGRFDLGLTDAYRPGGRGVQNSAFALMAGVGF